MDDERPRDDQRDDGLLEAVPGVVRVAATAWWHTTEWAVGTYLKAGRRLLGVALAPETAVDVAQDVRGAAQDVRDAVRGEEQRQAPPATAAERAASSRAAAQADADGEWSVLRDLGAELMRKSRDVHYIETAHPAYERMLDELAPDEGRILRLLLLQGPQPAADVRTGGPIGLVSSRLIHPGFSMIGARAGCRYPDRVPGYLNNLFRLGLIWFSRETLRDPIRYQVLEAQPEVLAAIKSVRMAKVIRRSIHLTPFGEDFCRGCLVLESDELVDLPVHAAPEEKKETSPPGT